MAVLDSRSWLYSNIGLGISTPDQRGSLCGFDTANLLAKALELPSSSPCAETSSFDDDPMGATAFISVVSGTRRRSDSVPYC